MRPRAADSDSVPVGVPQRAGATESLYVRVENQEIVAIGEYILRLPGVQEKNQLSLLSIGIRCKGGEKNFLFRPYKSVSYSSKTAVIVLIMVVWLVFG